MLCLIKKGPIWTTGPKFYKNVGLNKYNHLHDIKLIVFINSIHCNDFLSIYKDKLD